MADFLTHVFVPLTAAYVLRRELFASVTHFALGGFGLFADFDKFLGQPGLFHSLLTLGPICLGMLAVERWWRGEFRYAPLVVAFVLSHLLLDFVGGGPVPLLYPLVDAGVGLQYPVRTVFGVDPVGVAFQGPLVQIRSTVPRPGYNTYGFINGFGVTSVLLFVVIVLGLRADDRQGRPD